MDQLVRLGSAHDIELETSSEKIQVLAEPAISKTVEVTQIEKMPKWVE